MNRLLKTAFLFLLATLPLTAQVVSPCPTGKEGNIWYFGAYGFAPAGLDFNTGSPPAYLGDCGIPYNQGYEAYAIASDSDGQLLFYTNGDEVWNRNHQVMSGVGFGIGGHPSATQILTLPQPGSPGIHYIFYPEALEQNPQADTLKNMYYSVVDMALDGGFGDIALKKILLHTKTTEKVTAARHCNGEDWWVLTHELGSNRFFAWLLDNTGIAAQPVVSDIGLGNGGVLANKGGGVKISPNAKWVAMAESSRGSLLSPPYDGHIEVFGFDNQTGIVSDPILLQDSLRWAYGVEFSPDNTKVYFVTWDPLDEILQFDLAAGDSISIVQSRVVVADSNITTPAGMALAPDGKIYVANFSFSGIPQKSLEVIHQPNEKGAGCQYMGGAQGLLLPDSVGIGLGLPNFPTSYYAPLKPYLDGPREACLGDTMRYHVTGNCAAVGYVWEIPVGSITQQQSDSVWVQFNQPGEQQVIVHRMTACATWSDTMQVVVNGGLSLADSVFMCPGDSVQVFGQWISQAGGYSQTFTSAMGCDSTVAIVVTVFPQVDTTLLMLTSCDSSTLGTSIQILSTQNGCDSIVATIVNFSLADSVFLASTTCDPAAAGVFTNVFTNQNGCDSVVTETVSLLPSDSVFLASTTCDPAAAGVFTNVFTNQNGCDSVVTETVSLLPSDSTYFVLSTCNPEQVGTQVIVLANQNGCDSLVVVETIFEESLTVSFDGDVAIAQGDSVILEAEVSIPLDSISSIFWSPPNPCSNCLTLTVYPEVSTSYSIIVTSLDGCSALGQVMVVVESTEEQIFVPTAFSPNDDGINDRLIIYGEDGIKVRLLRIFDRWGEIVFEARDFPVNVESYGWDGSFRGKSMGSAVFVWTATVQFPNGRSVTIEGESAILR